MITTVLAFLLTLGLLIVIHEYGHYRVAFLPGTAPCPAIQRRDSRLNLRSFHDCLHA